ncbi:MAG: slipin family protein [Candidatus Krumholzibacteria bacterium]|nr:slipin family protein [Candidatus Krumholzibacteria bacterium]
MPYILPSTFLVLIFFILANSLRILREYERGVVFRLGRFVGTRGPGLIVLVPFIEKMVRVSLRTIAMDVEPQDVITKDNVSVRVNAVLYFRVIEPERAIIDVENFLFATSQLAQTTLRSVVGQAELDELLAERDKLNARVQTILDEATDPWGIKVMTVELKDVDLPMEMKRAMAKQAEAERERRAKVIHAEGEYQASQRLCDAAGNIEDHPVALQLRYLQALTEIAAENNSTTLFPVPIDLLTPFLKQAKEGQG